MKINFLFLLIFSIKVVSTPPPKYDSIFGFGDSLADTGNLLLSDALKFPVIGELPYGRTFFRYATGSSSIAEAYGLYYGNIYLLLKVETTYENGVNFAVAGATALDSKFFYDRKMGQILWTNDTLNVQLGWFKNLKPTPCSD